MTTTAQIDSVQKEQQGTKKSKRLLSVLFFIAGAVIITALAWWRQQVLFSTPSYALGDAAANSFLVIRAEHFNQIAGNYSRIGFYHPGAAFIYLLAFGEVLFYSWLNLVPAPFNGQVLISSLYAATILTLVALTYRRITRSWTIAALVLSIGFFYFAAIGQFGALWFPDLYLPAFLAFVVGAAALASGRTSELPLYVLGGGLLLHGHVSFLMFVGITSLIVAAAWLRHHRGRWLAECVSRRAAVSVGIGLLALFLLPLVVQMARNFPSPWREYLSYSIAAERAPRTWVDVLRFVGAYWTELPFPVPILIAAVVLAIALLIVDRGKRHRRDFGWLYGILVLQTALVLVYVARGVDFLVPREIFGYVANYYRAVPLLLLLTVAAHLLSWLRQQIPNVALRNTLILVTTFGTAFICWSAALNPTLGRTLPPLEEYHQIATQLRDHPDRMGRPIGLIHDREEVWADLSGIALELDRMGVPWCVDSPQPIIALVYTTKWVCSGEADRWVVHGASVPVQGDETVVWSGPLAFGKLTIYAPSIHRQ